MCKRWSGNPGQVSRSISLLRISSWFQNTKLSSFCAFWFWKKTEGVPAPAPWRLQTSDWTPPPRSTSKTEKKFIVTCLVPVNRFAWFKPENSATEKKYICRFTRFRGREKLIFAELVSKFHCFVVGIRSFTVVGTFYQHESSLRLVVLFKSHFNIIISCGSHRFRSSEKNSVTISHVTYRLVCFVVVIGGRLS